MQFGWLFRPRITYSTFPTVKELKELVMFNYHCKYILVKNNQFKNYSFVTFCRYLVS